MISFGKLFGAFGPSDHMTDFKQDFSDQRMIIMQKHNIQSLVSFLKKTIHDYENISNSYKTFGKITKQDDPKASKMYYNRYNKTRNTINKLAKIQHILKGQR